ncbi:NAD(P)-dependent oxidoreductase [Nakamurella sp. PAMC28650]|uniref:NAD(P)-dependent oxidoreductase n=1 Tax=Nakamurella sp. PAMC28650 TaxID=2762325 RepID=UPI00164CE2F2|nr:NAD(P)-dependent oxidoreductase [Nakamurella sp. PAMC28650]QNK81874.1 NAD(P)-dependent oxidoreductase [Nakamurella sp. PAMC28650]
MTTVAVLGTGTMGAGMARSLLREGFDVRVWNRSVEKAQPLADDGAVVAGTAAEAVAGAEVVVVMLFDVEAVLEVLRGCDGHFARGAVIVQSSTIGPDGTARLATLALDRGWNVLDAPVLGTRAPAEKGLLVVLASGDPDLRPGGQSVFDAIGSRTLWAGEDLGSASALKLACNAWVASLTAAAAQSLALARGAGLDPQLVLDAIKDGPSDSPYLQLKGTAMLAENYEVSFALDGVRKDLDLIAASAGANDVTTDLIDALRAVFGSASRQGHGDQDMASVITAF